MSSIRRARSSARPSAACGVLAINGEPCAPRTAGEFAHFRMSSASSSRRSSGAIASGRANAGSARSPVAACANAISSSSRSPMATMRGRMALPSFMVSRNTSRASRHARRVGRKRVARASSSGSSLAGKPGTNLPARSASISVDQKRCRSGNIEDIGCRSDSHGRIIHAKAGCGRSTRVGFASRPDRGSLAALRLTASGVPTCIHNPSSRRPCRRPARGRMIE